MNIEFEGVRDSDKAVRLVPKNLPEGKYFHFLLQGSQDASDILYGRACRDCPALAKSCTGVDSIDNWGHVYQEGKRRVPVKDRRCRIPSVTITVPEEGLSIWTDKDI